MSKFDRLQAVPYQLEFTTECIGGYLPSSKRRLRWSFGFADMKKINSGQTGARCKGNEHEIVLVWSLNSGKRVLELDGKEIHKSFSNGWDFFYGFDMCNEGRMRVIEVEAQCNYLMGEHFDLRIDGQSFKDMAMVFELSESMLPVPMQTTMGRLIDEKA